MLRSGVGKCILYLPTAGNRDFRGFSCECALLLWAAVHSRGDSRIGASIWLHGVVKSSPAVEQKHVQLPCERLRHCVLRLFLFPARMHHTLTSNRWKTVVEWASRAYRIARGQTRQRMACQGSLLFHVVRLKMSHKTGTNRDYLG